MSHVRRYRTVGPSGPGVYPQCVPSDGTPPHLLSWSDGAPVPVGPGGVEVGIRADASAMSLLSPSELAVLASAANGLTSLETGRRLGKGVETVKTQRHQILLKLGARNITQAVCIATEQGFLVVGHAEALVFAA